jgi:hypothetical protein
MHQQLWGYKVEKKNIYLGVRERKRLTITVLNNAHTWPGLNLTPIHCVQVVISLGVKWPEVVPDHSPAASHRVRSGNSPNS